jgi:hypothetical protein
MGDRMITSSRRNFCETAIIIVLAELLANSAIGADAVTEAMRQQRATYETQLSAYKASRAPFEDATDKYWQSIADKRSTRRTKRSNHQEITEDDFILQNPPEYTGPAEPLVPTFMEAELGNITQDASSVAKRPAIDDFLSAAKSEYDFIPRPPQDEKDYMLSFAREAVAVGFNAEQVVGVYALETGGLGPYSNEAGVFTMNNKCQLVSPRGSPASSLALGYVQLLPANTALTAKAHKTEIVQKLNTISQTAPAERAQHLRAKAVVFGRMVDDLNQWIKDYNGPKDDWREYIAHGKTPRGLAIHALLLDADIGPWLQVYKLLGIKQFASHRGVAHEMTSAELELINLVGDGRGVEALATPAAKNAASANLFDPSGYEGNPVAKNLTIGGLKAKLGEIIERHKNECGSKWFFEAFQAAEQDGTAHHL